MRRRVLATLLAIIAPQGWIEPSRAADVDLAGDTKAAGEVSVTFQRWLQAYERDLKKRAPGTSWVPNVEEVYAAGNLGFRGCSMGAACRRG